MTHRADVGRGDRPTPNQPSQPSQPTQAGLFDDLADSPSAVGPALLAIPVPAAAQSKAQRLFNKLIGQIRQQRELLAQWQAFDARFMQRVATELQPARAGLTAARGELLRLLDQLHSDLQAQPRLTKTQRRKLRAWIPELAATVLEDGPNAEAEAVFDRYSDISHAEMQQIELAGAEAMLGHFLGDDVVDGHQAESVDELMRHAAERMAKAQATQASAAAAAKPGPARSAKAQAAQQRQADAAEQAAKQASQTVREAFRKLASALHPDRETDPAAREHKTRLMQQANQAYERQDLLTLLSMQLDLEQIDSQHLADLPEDRLAHYNRVLREQLAALQQELGECTAHFRHGSGLRQRELTTAAVDKALSQDIEGLHQFARQIEQDTAQLLNPASRRDALAQMAWPDSDDDEPDAFETLLMMEAMVSAPGMHAPRKKRRRR